ncbi:hypothetical protein Lal_00026913 [Lupinus albus]|nr:hypothetical protein Lal_00026913 [Lupinus albus]
MDKYRNLSESQPTDQSQTSNMGKRVILRSTFVGSRRYMDQLYCDGMVICWSVGFLDLILKSTGLKPHNRLDIISRVFKMKFEELLQDLKKIHVLGKVLACKYIFKNKSFSHIQLFVLLVHRKRSLHIIGHKQSNKVHRISRR